MFKPRCFHETTETFRFWSVGAAIRVWHKCLLKYKFRFQRSRANLCIIYEKKKMKAKQSESSPTAGNRLTHILQQNWPRATPGNAGFRACWLRLCFHEGFEKHDDAPHWRGWYRRWHTLQPQQVPSETRVDSTTFSKIIPTAGTFLIRERQGKIFKATKTKRALTFLINNVNKTYWH